MQDELLSPFCSYRAPGCSATDHTLSLTLMEWLTMLAPVSSCASSSNVHTLTDWSLEPDTATIRPATADLSMSTLCTKSICQPVRRDTELQPPPPLSLTLPLPKSSSPVHLAYVTLPLLVRGETKKMNSDSVVIQILSKFPVSKFLVQMLHIACLISHFLTRETGKLLSGLDVKLGEQVDFLTTRIIGFGGPNKFLGSPQSRKPLIIYQFSSTFR